jgi:hypothetical protein
MRWLDGRCAWFGVVALFLNAVGCAHHHAQSSYAYAPPYAPPVYPQPYSATQAVASAAPAGVVVGAPVPPGAIVGTPVTAPVVSGIGPAVAPAGVPPCPQVPGATLVGSTDSGVTVVGGVQTPPCPPSP